MYMTLVNWLGEWRVFGRNTAMKMLLAKGDRGRKV